MRLLAVWGTVTGLAMSDAPACDLGSVFARCDREHKKAELTQQSRRPTKTSGFALSPIRAVFSDSNRWAVELSVKGSNLHFVSGVPFGGRPADKPKL